VPEEELLSDQLERWLRRDQPKTIVSAPSLPLASMIAWRRVHSVLVGVLQSNAPVASSREPTVKVCGAACARPDIASVAPAVRPVAVIAARPPPVRE